MTIETRSSPQNQSLGSLRDEELRARLHHLVRRERKLTVTILEHLAEVEGRNLHLQWGFPSIFDYLTRELGYSASAAYRRLQAARALAQLPELKEKVEKGSLHLTQIAEAQTSMRLEEKSRKDCLALNDRRAIYAKLENKTAEESRQVLLEELTTYNPWSKPFERTLRDESVQLNVHLEKATYQKLKRVRDLYSHIEPRGPWPRILDLMADDVIKKRDPATQASARTWALSNNGKPLKGKRLRAFIFSRDKGKCQQMNPDGTICGSTFQLEIDHIQPKFAGGSDEAENLRLLCRAHNQHRYRKARASRKDVR